MVVSVFKKMFPEKYTLVIFMAILILIVGIFVFTRYYSSKVTEHFALSLDDLDGTTANNNAPMTVTPGLEGMMKEISDILGTSNIKTQKDPLPGLCEMDSLCAGIREPLKLPIKQSHDKTGCGWYFAEDPDRQSFPAYGNKDGPISVKMQEAAVGGKWFFYDLSGAQLYEDRKKCNRVTTCKLADLYPTKCAWCEDLGKAIPIEEDSKRNKYPDDDDLNCQNKITYNPDKCKLPEKQHAYLDDNGKLVYPEQPPIDVCELEDGKMSRNCLIFLAKAAGHKEEGALIKILNKDPGAYTVAGTENNKRLKKVLEDIKHGGHLAYDMEYFGNGNCKRKAVISFYVELEDLVVYGPTQLVRDAAQWLSRGTGYDFDKCTEKMRGPYEISFLQRMFRKAGGQSTGTAYPKVENLEFYNGKKCTEIVGLFAKLCKEDVNSADPQTQLVATRKCLGIKIVTPIAGCIKRPNFTPDPDCNKVTVSGSVLIGDVVQEPFSGVEIFWYTWDKDWNLPGRGAAQSLYLGREVRLTLPSISENDPNFCPFSSYNFTNLVMVIRTTIRERGPVRDTLFNVTANNGIAISIDDNLIMKNWGEGIKGTGKSNEFTINNMRPMGANFFWYSSANPSLAIQIKNQEGEMEEVTAEKCKTRVDKGFPIVRFDFYAENTDDGNKVVSSLANTSAVTFGKLQEKGCLIFNGNNGWVKTQNKIAGGAFVSFTTMLLVSKFGGTYNQNRFFCLRQGGDGPDVDKNLSNSVAIEGCMNGNDNSITIALKSNTASEDRNGNNILLVTSPKNTLKLNKWTHIAAVFTCCMSSCKLYVDGVLVAENKNSKISEGYYTKRIYDYAAIGHGYSQWTDDTSPLPFYGGMAWQRWFDYPMTANDVMKDKNNKFVNTDLYPGGQGAGWNVPPPNGGNMANNGGMDGGGSTIPGCPAQNTPAVNRPNPYRFTHPTAPTGKPEVFHSGGYNTLDYNAESVCSNYNGAKVATKTQLAGAQAAGADWCSTGWVSDNYDAQYPINVSIVGGCGGAPGIQTWTPPSKKAGVNCYGIKPREGEFPEIKPWTPGTYYQKDYVKPPPPPPPPIPPPEWDITSSRIAGYVDIPNGDYTLSFDVTANSKSMGKWGNIIHVNNGQGDCCGVGNRAPAIWFWPDDTRLHVRIGSTVEGNWGIDTDPLPIGQKVNFNLTTSGSQVNLTVNGKSYNQTQPGKRPTGTGFKIYMNDLRLQPGYQAAPAKIENLKYVVDGKTVNVLQKGEAPNPPSNYDCKSGIDRGGADIWCRPTTKEAAEAACDADPNCKSYNTWGAGMGCIKFESTPINVNGTVTNFCVKKGGGGYTDLGCWMDTGDRHLKGSNQGRPHTKDSCGAKAKALGHKYFSVQDGNECYTGNDNYSRFGKAPGDCALGGGPWIAHTWQVN